MDPRSYGTSRGWILNEYIGDVKHEMDFVRSSLTAFDQLWMTIWMVMAMPPMPWT